MCLQVADPDILPSASRLMTQGLSVLLRAHWWMFTLHFFFKKYFIVYIVTVVPIFLFAPSTQPASHYHSQSSHRCPCSWVLYMWSNPFTFFPSVPTSLLPSYSYQSVPCFCASGSILLISLFCSLSSSYR